MKMANKYTASEWAAMEGGHSLPEKDDRGLSFMQELSEARLFKTRNQISGEGARVISDHIFVSILALYIMSMDYEYAPVAVAYARKTNMYGAYNQPSPSGTDLYQALYSIQHPELFQGQAKDELLMGKVNIEPRRVKKLLDRIKSGQVNPSTISSELYRLERNLKIQEPKLRAARRLAQNWNTLNTTQRQLVATQINRYFIMNAMRSDIYPIFSKFAKSQNLIVDDSKKAKIGKAIARKAAAFTAGYVAGKSLEL
jgi:hypothetical protein